uniref:GCN5-related N-acetyltransferase n=1 Tax=mine drainage metagenome TaxID=410659 RepID=E6PWS9_9ZZZZ
MATGILLEIRDLRHYSSDALRPVLEAESNLWQKRLNWDYLGSARLLLQYLDSHSLPGFVALDRGPDQGMALNLNRTPIIGYIFCVYEENKAVIGNVFARPAMTEGLEISPKDDSRHAVEATLLGHMIEMLTHSPGVERIETQLLLHRDGAHTALLEQAGFHVARRLYLERRLLHETIQPNPPIQDGFLLRRWQDTDLTAASQLIVESYRNHPDSGINDQYRSISGAQRFLYNIVRYPGCGVFVPEASHLILDRQTDQPVGIVLGSRISPECGHITQICMRPAYRRLGLARHLLRASMEEFQKMGMTELTLTVTQANDTAVRLYLAEGFRQRHRFDAAVWQRNNL